MIDPRTDAERRYDAARDGSLYFPHTPTAPPVTYQLTRFDDGSGDPWDEYHCGGASFAICGNSHLGDLMLYAAGCDIGPLSADDLAALRALLNDARVLAAAGL